MDNGKYPKQIFFTEVLERHKGYIIEWAIRQSESEPGKWMSDYRACKEDASTLRASLGWPYATEAEARDKAIEFAKTAVDEAVAEYGRR